MTKALALEKKEREMALQAARDLLRDARQEAAVASTIPAPPPAHTR